MADRAKLIVMYYGRFQPPHLGHYGVYKELTSKFGGAVYIGTSNKTDPDKSPLTFQWKQKLLRTMGIPASRVIQTKQNYNAQEVQKQLGVDPDYAVFICAVGQKDGQRLAKYFEKYKKGMKLEPMSKKAYYYVIPNIKMDGKIMSATEVRKVLRKDELTAKDYTFLKKATGASRAQVDNLKPMFEGHGYFYADYIPYHHPPIIIEGGKGGHMSHPYEDRTITFSAMEKMIELGLSGELTKQEVTEKVDGQNLFASIINGKLRLGRNKGDTKNHGAGSMTIPDMAKKWASAPHVAEAFVEGAKILEKELLKLSSDDQMAIFANGQNWVNIEVIWNVNKNVIDYDRDVIVLHNVTIVDEDGNNAGVDLSAQKNLFAKISHFNSIDKSNVEPPSMLKISKSVDFSRKKGQYLARLAAFRNKQKVVKGKTLGQWMDRFWDKKIRVLEKKFNHKLSKAIRDRIVNRFVNYDKSYSLTKIRKDIAYEPLFTNIRDFDKNLGSINKEATMPLEMLFLDLGVEVLKNVESFLTANPDKTLNALRKDISAQISKIRSSKDVTDLDNLHRSLRKIQSLGGFKELVPTEGIVFKFNNKVYKLTGLYAPVNQLMGIGRFGR